MSKSAVYAGMALAGCGALKAASLFALPTLRPAGTQSETQLRGVDFAENRAGTAPQNSGVAGPLMGFAAVAAGLAATRKKTRSQVPEKVATRAFENSIGVQAPIGFWDPLEFCADGDAEAFKRRRCVELKHGRVSMYACIGYIVPEYFRWPGELSPSESLKFTDVPNGLAAFSKVPLAGWFQIVAFIGLIETTGWTFTKSQNIGFMKDASMDGEPGNYGLGFIGAFNLIPRVPELRTRKLQSELANGRLAMVAILGLLFQNGTLGSTGLDMYWFEPLPEYAGTVGDFVPKNL